MTASIENVQNDAARELARQKSKCQFCNDLEFGSKMVGVQVDDWVFGTCRSSCLCCQILVKAIRRIEPDFLTGPPHPDRSIVLSADKTGRISSWIIKDGWSHPGLEIQLFNTTDVSPDFPFIGLANEIQPVPGHPKTWGFLRERLHDCLKHHEICKLQQASGWYPTRLLRVVQKDGGIPFLQLVETQTHRPSSRYITLSHCWGERQPLRTTTENISRHKSQIYCGELPRTFQDTITVAGELDIQYIWIDSLCIIQDERTDWIRHARVMDKIYQNSLFTVAAVSSDNSSVPFLGPDAPSDRKEWQAFDLDISELDIPLSRVKARRCSIKLYPDWIEGPLESRAWAWQERHFSVRKLDFTQQEVRWNCQIVTTCECSGSGLGIPLVPRSAAQPPRKTTRMWRDAVGDYAARDLTYWTDRLPALSGVASRFGKELDSTYLAGSWSSDFPRCLAWYRTKLGYYLPGKPIVWRSLDNGNPSWSWASVSSRIRWLWEQDFDIARMPNGVDLEDVDTIDIPIQKRVELVGYDCRPLSSENPFGEVRPHSYLEVKGRVIQAEMESDIHGRGLLRRQGSKPQLAVPDCLIISEDHVTSVKCNSLDVEGKRRHQQVKRDNLTVLRRALPTDKLEGDKRFRGPVTCLLLSTQERLGTTRPCILILGEQYRSPLSGDDLQQPVYQRLGLAAGSVKSSGPTYAKDEKFWEGWEELGEWEDWEMWFKYAKEKTVRIV